MTSFAEGIMEDRVLRPIILQCARIGLGETSEDTIDIALEMIEEGKGYLHKWAKKFEKLHLDMKHAIPHRDKLCVTNATCNKSKTYTCNQEIKSLRLMKEAIGMAVVSKDYGKLFHYLSIVINYF